MTAYFVLENETKRKNYFHMLEVKYYLSQPFDMETINSKYGIIAFYFLSLTFFFIESFKSFSIHNF